MGIAGLATDAAVFLDRDGVLNKTTIDRDGVPRPPGTVEDLVVLDGVPEACRVLRDAGFRLLVVTNQPDVARGTLGRKAVESINKRLASDLPIDDVLVCYHDDADACSCRKPEPGLLIEGAKRWRIDVSKSFMVGDRWRDIEAARRAGCRSVLISEYSSKQDQCEPDYTAPSLSAAAAWILAQE